MRIDIINKLDNALDDWCAQCLKLDADTCDNCMARYFDAWLEDRRVEEEHGCRVTDVFKCIEDMGGEE